MTTVTMGKSSKPVALLRLLALALILSFKDSFCQEFPQVVQRPQKHKSTSVTMDKHLKELEELEKKKERKPKYQYAKVEADGRVHVNGVDIPITETQATTSASTNAISTEKATAKRTPIARMEMKQSKLREDLQTVSNMVDDDYVEMNTTTSTTTSGYGSVGRRLTTPAEDAMNAIPLDGSLTLYVEPEDGYFSEKAMAVFARCNNPSSEVRIYYEL